MTADDPELLDRLAEGDDAALEALLAQHLPALHGFVRLHAGPSLKSHEETIDLVQSVCREILERKDRFVAPKENGFKRWLYKTAIRKIGHRAEYWRAGKRDAARETTGGGSLSTDELLECYGSICTPSQDAAAREQVTRIETAFDQLPDHYREVVVLNKIAGMRHAEIAAELGKSEVAVRTILSRALAKLADLLDE